MSEQRHTKVLRLEILKPTDGLSWKELAQLLRDVRYRVFRLGNLAVSEAYLAYHLHRTGRQDVLPKQTIGQLNKTLRSYLEREKAFDGKTQERICKDGALPSYVCDALAKYKIGALRSRKKWADVLRGKAALPTFRLDMAIPIRCDKLGYRRLERTENGDVALELMCCRTPYPRVVLKTAQLDGGPRAVLERLLDNPDQKLEGYRQRCFEVKEDTQSRKWWVNVSYDLPAQQPQRRADVIVGVDVGVSVPLYAALSNGHARLGRRQLGSLGARIRSLQRQVMARRRSIQRGGSAMTTAETARSGHGVTRRLLPTEKLQGRVDHAYQTLNHQLSWAVVKFARDHGAGVIQMEDLSGLQERLRGTFIWANWRYRQLQDFMKYKAEEAGIELRFVRAAYTSRRCSKCGFIHMGFDRTIRDAAGQPGRVTPFLCPECDFKADPDYNAARNLATLDIAALIKAQCAKQGLELPAAL